MKKTLLILICCSILFSCQSNIAQEKTKNIKIVKPETEWKKQLDPLSYHVLRESGTERAFTGKYDKFYKEGVYQCKGCNTPLFKSEHKYNSGSGWPSFDTAIKGNIGYDTDYNIGVARTEIHCNICDGHLGHVFDDGPKGTTGKRYCVNSASLIFKEKEYSN